MNYLTGFKKTSPSLKKIKFRAPHVQSNHTNEQKHHIIGKGDAHF